MIERNVLDGNEASDEGGGLFLTVEASSLANNVFQRNVARHRGGGLLCTAANDLRHNTVAFNTAGDSGGGLALFSRFRSTAVNNIFWRNAAPLGPEIQVGDASNDAVLALSSSDVEHGRASIHVEDGSTLDWGPGSIDDDPRFVAPDLGDLHLDRWSPCINRGEGVPSLADDVDGDARPQMGTVDMGADEFTGAHPLAASGFAIPAARGGAVDFSLDAGATDASRDYLLLGSISGTAPGSPLPGDRGTLPLNWDAFSTLLLRAALQGSPATVDFHGTLDVGGAATARLDTLGPLPPAAVGLTWSLAYALARPWDRASNPVRRRDHAVATSGRSSERGA